MSRRQRIFTLCQTLVPALLLASTPGVVRAQRQDNPFGPKVTAKKERVRDYHVSHLLLRLNVGWPSRVLTGTVTHTVTPLRDGLNALVFDAGTALTISKCTVNGEAVTFKHEQEKLTLPLAKPLPRDSPATVVIEYTLKAPLTNAASIGGFGAGWTWIEPDKFNPDRVPGFWTQGETSTNHQWVPCYDYPNDKMTSEVVRHCAGQRGMWSATAFWPTPRRASTPKPITGRWISRTPPTCSRLSAAKWMWRTISGTTCR